MTTTRSINLNQKDAINLNMIINSDPRVGGPSEALRVSFEDAARVEQDWISICEKAKNLDYSVSIPDSEITTRSFLVEDETYLAVFNSVKEQLNMKKPQVSFLTRLCLYSARIRLQEKNMSSDIILENIDAMNLLESVCCKTAQLIREGRLRDVKNYLEV